MRYLLIIFWLTTLSFTAAWSVDYTVKDTNSIGRKLPVGVVIIAPTKIKSQPFNHAKTLYTLKLGDKVSIVSQTKAWFGIRLQTSQGTILAAWVEKIAVQVVMPRAVESNQAPVVTPPPVSTPAAGTVPSTTPAVNSQTSLTSIVTKGKSENKAQTQETHFQIGLLGAPVFDVSKFGTNQKRVGVFTSFRLLPMLSLDVPVSYTLNGGFHSFQAGLGGVADIWKSADFRLYGRLAVMGEKFFSKSKHFYSVTTDVGLGVEWMFSRPFGLSLEPACLEAMVYNTQRIPINYRAQGIVRLIYEW